MPRATTVQCRPITALPATPTQPAIAVCAPIRTLWPIWIRLSSLTPSRSPCRQRAAIDAGVCADFHIVTDANRAKLLDLFPSGLRWAQSRSHPHRSRLRCGSSRARRSHALTECDTCRQARPGAYAGVSSDDAVRADRRAVSHLHAGLHHHERADRDAEADARRCVDHRTGVHAGWRSRSKRAVHHWVRRA